MGAFIPRDIPESHWHQLTGNKTYAIKCDENSAVHLRFGIGGMFIAINIGEDNERVISTVNMGDGILTEVGRFAEEKPLSLGRSSECQIRISHPILSRKHVDFSADKNILLVKDLGSTNGTFCHSENFLFDVEDYIAKHSSRQNVESTLDEVHEAFGPGIDDFLTKYLESNKKDGK